ncbi:MFS transporter [Microlunatus antarcticus]|uniref:MFS family permease n=1 Tax=Microlunatus antarcticus TaxID=53388 RepID=A0A7W5JSH7_9ACTN|nr:MFS family permease [Microlunatus antarcticus]
MPHSSTSSPVAIQAGVRATYAAFIATGFAFASWASEIPQVRDRLELSSAQLGLVLLAIAAGSVISLPLAGPVVARIGSRRTVQLMALVDAVALVVVGLGYLGGVVPVVVGLFLFGFGQGAWDVAMNVQGAVVERRLGRAIMPRFHAGFSIGTVGGALSGAALVGLGVGVTVHLVVVGVLVAAVVPFVVRGFVADADEPVPGDGPAPERRSALAAWREPRTLLVGLFVLAFAFAEGTGNDWTSVALIDGYGTSRVVGILGFATFLAAMTAGRWFGPELLDRYGRVAVCRVMAAASGLGLLLFVFGGHPALAFAGAVLWGAGLSLGFPVGMSAGADDPAHAASRVSVIASIGYLAFLGGPPLIGFLGEHIGVLHALTAVAVLLALAVAIAGTVRPLPSDDRR